MLFQHSRQQIASPHGGVYVGWGAVDHGGDDHAARDTHWFVLDRHLLPRQSLRKVPTLMRWLPVS